MEIYYRIVIGTVFLKLTLSPKRTDLTKHLFGVWNKVWKNRENLSLKKFFVKSTTYNNFFSISSKTIAFSKFLGEKCERERISNISANLRIFVSLLFSVKMNFETFALLVNRWFQEIFVNNVCERISVISTLCCGYISNHTSAVPLG